MKDLVPYLVPGKTIDDLSGLTPEFGQGLAAMFAAAPPEVRQGLRITSAYRSPERQAQLWQEALQKYGSEQAARKWVAPPGRSKHNHGMAVDLKYLAPHAQKWAHQNAAKYGLVFPLAHEPWHIEPVGARGKAPVMIAQDQTAAGNPQTSRRAGPQSAPIVAPVPQAMPGPGFLATFPSPQTPDFIPPVPDSGLASMFTDAGTAYREQKARENSERKQRLAMLFQAQNPA